MNHIFNRNTTAPPQRPRSKNKWARALLATIQTLAVLGSATAASLQSAPQAVLAQGTPTIAVSPTSITNFTYVPPATSDVKTVTLSNTGTAALSVTGLTFSGAAASKFAVSGGTCGSPPISVAASGSCTVQITYSNGSAIADNASLDIASDDPANATTSVALTGIIPVDTGGGSGSALLNLTDINAAELDTDPQNNGDANCIPLGGGSALLNTVTISATELDSDASDNFAAACVYSTAAAMLAPDLTTAIGQPAPRLMEGVASAVPVIVTNSGTATTTGSINITMTLPSGVTAPATFSNNGWSCTTSGSTVACSNAGPLAPNASSTVQVPITPNSGTAGSTPGPFNATAGTPGETATSNNAATPMTPGQSVQAPSVVTPGTPSITSPTNGSTLTNTYPVIGGTGTAGATITVTEGTTTICTATVVGSTWSCTPSTPLASGAHSIKAVAGNTAGTSAATPNTSFTIDNTPPAAPVISAPAPASTTNDNTPLFSGSAENGSTVTVKKGTTVLCTTTADATTGAWSCASNVVLPEGSNTVQATAIDAAGNPSPTATDTFTVATTPNLITSIGAVQPVLMATQVSTLPVSISNVGVAPSSGPVTATVSLPPATSAPASFTSGPWTCTATQPPDPFTASTVTCTSSAAIPVNGASTILVPVTPSAAAIGFTRTFNASAAGGGEAITTDNAATPYTSGAVLPVSRLLPIKVFLFGPFNAVSGIMQDSLRARGMLPTTEPYSGLGYARAGTSGETAASGVFSITGSAAPVDWVLVELRDASNAATIITTKAGLLLANGYVKDVDAVSDLYFTNLTAGSYFVAIKHRNHLGAMTASPVTLSSNTPLVDFTTLTAAQVNGTNARRQMGGIFALWAGNANGNTKIEASGSGNDATTVTTVSLTGSGNTSLSRNFKVSGYRLTDTNMDGDTVAGGTNNDWAVVINSASNNPANAQTLNRNTNILQQVP